MDKEQLKAHGLNDSVTHVDFMVGTADLSIVGTTRDGREGSHFYKREFRHLIADKPSAHRQRVCISPLHYAFRCGIIYKLKYAHWEPATRPPAPI